MHGDAATNVVHRRPGSALAPLTSAVAAGCLHRCCTCRYGNTSSSTVWYSFGFVESVQGVRKGDIVWQVSPPVPACILGCVSLRDYEACYLHVRCWLPFA